MLGMIFEVGVQLVGQGRAKHVKQPGQLVVDEGEPLGDPVILPARLFTPRAGEKFLQDEQVPLFVVLLSPRLRHPVVNAPGQPSARRDVGDRDVGNLLPALIRNPGHEFKHLELRQRPLAPIKHIKQLEQ